MTQLKRGRPPLPDAENARLSIRLTETLLWQVKAAAVAAHMGLGDYVKTALREKMNRDDAAETRPETPSTGATRAP